MPPIRVILGFHDALCSAGLRALLERLRDVQVVDESSDGRALIKLATKKKPDILLIEDGISGLRAVDVASRLASAAPGVRVAILSDLADAPSVAEALKAGAKGYLLKTASAAALPAAIRDLMRGRVHLSSGVSKKLLSGPRRARSPLTPRQREILQMIAEGWATKEIAQILRISPKTVETHRAQLMDRLKIYNVPDLVRYALKTRLTRL